MNTHKDFATNMSVKNCDFDNFRNNEIFKFKVEPNDEKSYLLLNSDAYTNMYDKDFYPICGGNSTPNPNSTQIFDRPPIYGDSMYNNVTKGCRGGYVSSDPRLISAVHSGDKIILDRPPLFGEVKLKDIYTDPSLDNYGKRYRNYADIKTGQIMYYFDKSISGNYFNPVFVNESVAVGRNYRDPMDSYKPSYERLPVKDKNRQGYKECLSFLADTNESREDLISFQMKKMNRQKYAARWT